MATAKTTTRKAPVRKTTRAKRVAKRPPAGPMPKEVREAAAAALTMFEEKLLEHENIGLVGAATRELKGARSGLMKAVRFEGSDGSKHRAVVQVVYR